MFDAQQFDLLIDGLDICHTVHDLLNDGLDVCHPVAYPTD